MDTFLFSREETPRDRASKSQNRDTTKNGRGFHQTREECVYPRLPRERELKAGVSLTISAPRKRIRYERSPLANALECPLSGALELALLNVCHKIAGESRCRRDEARAITIFRAKRHQQCKEGSIILLLLTEREQVAPLVYQFLCSYDEAATSPAPSHRSGCRKRNRNPTGRQSWHSDDAPTLICHLMALPQPNAPKVRILGVDDWSWKKGLREDRYSSASSLTTLPAAPCVVDPDASRPSRKAFFRNEAQRHDLVGAYRECYLSSIDHQFLLVVF
jgi:hypothetical protein